MVGLEAVDGVQEVGAHHGVYEGVDVFEDQHTGGHLAGLHEDGEDAEFGAAEGGEGFDVEHFDGGVRALADGVHEGFDGDCFAVAGGAVED